MIKYPKLIKTATEKLANVREDIKARDKELIDNPDFAITIGNATYTERVDGGTVMLEAISKCKTGETTPVGKFHGFELRWKRISSVSTIWCFVERRNTRRNFPQVRWEVW